MQVDSIELFQKACPIDYSDSQLELVPENYLDQAPPSSEEIKRIVEGVVRDSAAFLVRSGMEDDV
jgi:hypothetical protein